MNTVEQLHKELVRAVKLGFLPTYLVKEVTWEAGVVVLQTRHLNIFALKGPEIRIPAPTEETLEEVKDNLSEGVWFSSAARWTVHHCSKGYMVMPGAGTGVLLALRAVGYDGYTFENVQTFKDKTSLKFISIFNKYSHRA